MEINELKNQRVKYGISQKEAAAALGIPLRTYVRYENNEYDSNSFKYRSIFDSLVKKYEVTEEKGILTLDFIKKEISSILVEENIEYCYLFGSYSRNKAKDESDVDICISTDIDGLKFFGLIEKFRVRLHKKVDLITVRELTSSPELLEDILKEGIRIYGKTKR